MGETAKQTVLNYTQIENACNGCIHIIDQLGTIYAETGTVSELIAETYEGDAKAEMDAFLEGFQEHIYRLQMLYAKMVQFIVLTQTSFQTNDTRMAGTEGE